jgi:predicted ABC-type ATPase
MNSDAASSSRPIIVAVAGPNGAGKSTVAPALLEGTLGVTQFVNADVIAQGLAGFSPETVAIEAGRIMLRRIKSLAARGLSFAFETTLSSRTFAPWLRGLASSGYTVAVMYFWLPNVELAVRRVRSRVALGGHDVPEEIVRRRYRSSITNFMSLYAPQADAWWLYDNEGTGGPRLVATKHQGLGLTVHDASGWLAAKEASHG